MMSRKELIIVVVLVGAFAIYMFWDINKMSAFTMLDDSPRLTIAEVEKMVGQPSHIEHSETTGITGDVYHYPYQGKDMRIVFVNGVVFHHELVPGAKS